MKSVAVCASKKHKVEVRAFCRELRKLGIVVYEPNIHEPVDKSSFFHSKHLTKTIFKGLTLEHFDWIRKADVCFIFNKDGYVGVSVTLEMGYASALGKPIYALEEKTGDPCRDALINAVVSTPSTLANLLA